MSKLLIAAALAAACVSANTALFPERLRGGRVYREAVAAERAHHARIGYVPNMTKNWFPAPIDHSNPSLGTFQDKFYYDTSYFNGTYCMFYLNGEGPLGSSVGGYMAELAQGLNACTVTIEHRWYGESLPGGTLLNKALLTQTLTVDQAMQDVRLLMTYFETNVIKRNVTWFLVGGSYSGGMTVWLNEKYPGLFKASWAASGVVRATFAFTDYDGHVAAVTSADCSNGLRQIMQFADWAYEQDAARLFAMFNVPSYNTKTDFMWAMADMSASSVQYSMNTQMCAEILPVPQEPWAALAKYAAFMVRDWGEGFAASCYYSTHCLASKSLSSGWAAGGYSWIWECCNQMAWWQIGYPNSIRNRNISTEYFTNQCRAAFYENTTSDPWTFNKRHHGLHPQTAGYIIATQGSDDPWSTTGLKYDVGPTFPVNTAECANCGHCGSMMSPRATDPPNLQLQRTLVKNSLTQWLAR